MEWFIDDPVLSLVLRRAMDWLLDTAIFTAFLGGICWIIGRADRNSKP